MSWTHEIFQVDNISVTLPLARPEEDVDTGEASGIYQRLAGGDAIDEAGTDQVWPGMTTITRRGIYIGETKAELEQQLRDLMALHGKSGRLFRRSVDTGQLHWAYSRLARVRIPFTPDHVLHRVVDTTFERRSRSWFSEQVRDIEILDIIEDADDLLLVGVEETATGGEISLFLANDGNAAVNDVVIEVTATTDPITGVLIQGSLSHLVWTGTLAVGQTLRLDSARKQIKRVQHLTALANVAATALAVPSTVGVINGTIVQVRADTSQLVQRTVSGLPSSTQIDLLTPMTTAASAGQEVSTNAYAGFEIGLETHQIDDWLRLEPGLNPLVISLTPATEATVNIRYYDGWK